MDGESPKLEVYNASWIIHQLTCSSFLPPQYDEDAGRSTFQLCDWASTRVFTTHCPSPPSSTINSCKTERPSGLSRACGPGSKIACTWNGMCRHFSQTATRAIGRLGLNYCTLSFLCATEKILHYHRQLQVLVREKRRGNDSKQEGGVSLIKTKC